MQSVLEWRQALDVMRTASQYEDAPFYMWSGLTVVYNSSTFQYRWLDGSPLLWNMRSVLQLPQAESVPAGACIAADLVTGKAVLVDCGTPAMFVCKGGTFPSAQLQYNGVTHTYFTEQADARTAAAVCTSYGADLAVLRDTHEAAMVGAMAAAMALEGQGQLGGSGDGATRVTAAPFWLGLQAYSAPFATFRYVRVCMRVCVCSCVCRSPLFSFACT